eukprot:CAMPEP_0205924598 /NCGR_PEP_ID=MMETSP1325-20131115/17069_1 /ASSEMBLY_ACC=CAM_ASM_000708 /TAXON_ID=236786 /ORGANISM="Florenciella sp., Strain RCC1007" /LENGTH=146 /DNA_ID=CAMNT_0053292985 /DNA_START=38 /DNA_END=475 /DNA_ORIENTATION=-
MITSQVDHDPTDMTWSLYRRTSNPSSYGCDMKVAGMQWNPARYVLVKPSTHRDAAGRLHYKFPKTTLEDVAIVVRSRADPYIEAMLSTNGSLNFGIGSNDAYVTALVCLLIGLLLAIQPGCQFYECYRTQRARGKEQRYSKLDQWE